MDTAVHSRRISAHRLSYRVARAAEREESQRVAEADVLIGEWHNSYGRTYEFCRRLAVLRYQTRRVPDEKWKIFLYYRIFIFSLPSSYLLPFSLLYYYGGRNKVVSIRA